jgi:SAM-dependent methyltransferase
MSDWQERITQETAPAIRVEHELRYRLATPLIVTAGTWADLGCGNGLAAAAALGEERPDRTVLVDRDPEVVARATLELAVEDAVELPGDLTDPGLLAQIGEALTGEDRTAVVTCFEVVEHLATFLPLIEWSVKLARECGVTFLLSVPNDAFWAIQNPHHVTSWSEGAFEELRRLLPPEQTLVRQVALAGSAIVPWEQRERHELSVQAGGEGTVATHFIVAFGPRHEQLSRFALAAQAEVLEQRRWERERESNLALLQKLTGERAAWFEQWREYIHELERELGRPLSGASEEERPETAEHGA